MSNEKSWQTVFLVQVSKWYTCIRSLDTANICYWDVFLQPIVTDNENEVLGSNGCIKLNFDVST